MAHALSLRAAAIAAVLIASGAAVPVAVRAGPPAAAADKFPPFEGVVEGLQKVVSTSDEAQPLWDLYKDDQSGRLLAVLSPNYEKQLLMIACTVAGGDPEAGVMGPTHYVRWERYDGQLALVAPELFVRSEGNPEAAASVEKLFTGRVMLSVPILAMAPGNRPVIDLGTMATTQVRQFFGASIFGPYGASLMGVNTNLKKLTKAKAFPENLVFEYQAPGPDGRIMRFAHSISELSGTPGYKPRKADDKIGYYYDFHQDFSRPSRNDLTDRYITRWHVEKRDPSLRLSPPREPIVWYIEHTVPVRYRRYVREGIEMWNEAFEEIGILGAVEVRQQDAATGAFMNVDPEDARYNFFRWNTTDLGYAIGPSRSNPLTGEILDADVVWHQGLTHAARSMFENLSTDIAEHAFSPETLDWLTGHPDWDPRVLLATPSQRARLLRDRAMGEVEEPSLGAHRPTVHGAECSLGRMLAMDMSLADAAFVAGVLDAGDCDSLDGLPEDYIGQMIRYISAHEVGHCMGLQHNMIASSVHSLKEVNSPGFSGPTTGSVMDYNATNINYNLGEVQGPYATAHLGPYDKWAIAFGYGPDADREALLKRAGEPELVYQSQVDIAVGGDPRNNTWDFGADNLEFAESRLGLVREVRAKLLDKVVKDGEPWAVARRRYQSTLGTHLQMLSIASRWVGGSFFNNDAKGDPGNRPPVQDIPGDTQRRALRFIIDNAFNDAAFGLSPDLVRHFGKEHWWDPAGLAEIELSPEYSVHDAVAGAQGTALTMILNPTTLRRVYDNEYRQAGQQGVLTLAEVLKTVTDSAWTECANPSNATFTTSNPMVSSFRRNLQQDHVNRLETLALLNSGGPAMRTIRQLAAQELRRIDGMAEKALAAKCDPYTAAHLTEVRARIARALEASIVLTR